eukprot:7849068-Pyramimonas_sp.AAC.1
MAYVTLMGKWRTRLSLTMTIQREVANCIIIVGLGMQKGVIFQGSYRDGILHLFDSTTKVLQEGEQDGAAPPRRGTYYYRPISMNDSQENLLSDPFSHLYHRDSDPMQEATV